MNEINMKELTWKEAFLSNKSLKDLRKEYNLNIPEEYIGSTKKLLIASLVYGMIFGLAFSISIIVDKLNT